MSLGKGIISKENKPVMMYFRIITLFLLFLLAVHPVEASFTITDEATSIVAGAVIPGSVFVDDINVDGSGEITVETYDNITLYSHDGTKIWTAVLTGSHMTLPKMPDPIAGNIAGDGNLEVIFGDKSSAKLYAWNSVGTAVTGFPKTLTGGIFSTAGVADIDNDGLLEIAIGTDSKLVYLFNGDGTSFPGWPVTVGGNVRSQPAFGDIDHDGEPEIMVTSSSYDGNTLLFSSVYAFNLNGTNVNGWPKDIKTLYGTGTRYTSPAVGDLDNDGYEEVVVASTYEFTNSGKIIAFDGDGSELWRGATNLNPYSSPRIGNLDRDPYPEVVIGSLWKVSAFEHDGTLKWENSIGNSNEIDSNPVCIDVTGDGVDEVFAATKSGLIFGWYGDGWEFMKQAAGGEVRGSPALFDIDGDSMTELLAGIYNTGEVKAWNIDFIPVYPTARIVKPSAGSEFEPSDTINFEGEAGDEDGRVIAVEWYSDRDGNIGSNPSFSISTLSTGIHVISFRVIDSDGLTWTDEVIITVEDKKSPGGGGSGGGGFTGENYSNVNVKESVSQYILGGKEISYKFKNVDPILAVEFTALRSAGSVTAIVEILNNTSSLVSVPPPHVVYRNMNIYVGLYGFATEYNIQNATILFRVKREWIESNDIDSSAVALYNYIDGVWIEQPTEITSQDDSYIYYKSRVNSFSQFAISGRERKRDTVPSLSDVFKGIDLDPDQLPGSDVMPSGANIIYLYAFAAVAGMLAAVVVYLRKRRKK